MGDRASGNLPKGGKMMKRLKDAVAYECRLLEGFWHIIVIASIAGMLMGLVTVYVLDLLNKGG